LAASAIEGWTKPRGGRGGRSDGTREGKEERKEWGRKRRRLDKTKEERGELSRKREMKIKINMDEDRNKMKNSTICGEKKVDKEKRGISVVLEVKHFVVPSAVIILVFNTSKGFPTTDPRAPELGESGTDRGREGIRK
jgi:hypothetical protein